MRAEREGSLRQKIRFYRRFALLIVDEIGYLPVVSGGGNLFFQLVNARYERGAMILTSNRGFAEWGEVFGDPVVATALLDRLAVTLLGWLTLIKGFALIVTPPRSLTAFYGALRYPAWFRLYMAFALALSAWLTVAAFTA